MASGEIIAGRGAIRVGGRIYNCEGITVRMGTEERSAVVGMLGVAGFKAEPVPPEVEATGITCDSGVKIATLDGIINETVEVSMASGRSFVLEGATRTGRPEYDVAEGKTSLSLAGVTCTERGV